MTFETLLASEVLGVERVGRWDDFFKLILGLQLARFDPDELARPAGTLGAPA